MRALSIQDGLEIYRVVIRQGLATVHDSRGALVRVHRIDGGKLPPSPDDKLMQILLNAIRGTEGGPEYLDACALVRAARESALADPASKWRDYEAIWLSARRVREGWEASEYIPRTTLTPRSPTSSNPPEPPSGDPAEPAKRLPRDSRRRRLVAWGQR